MSAKKTKKTGRPIGSSRSGDGRLHPFCINVKNMRIEKSLSQDDLAKKVGVGRTWVTKLENGTYPIDPDRIVRLSRALDVTIDWLFTNDPDG